MCYNFISVCAVREIYHLKNICYKKLLFPSLKKCFYQVNQLYMRNESLTIILDYLSSQLKYNM